MAKKPRGSHNWVEDWKAQFISRIGNDKRSLRSVVKDKDMPSHPFVYKELEADELFAAQYARASVDRADAIFEEILEIADDASNDYMESHEGVVTLNSEHVQRSRLRIDSRKWMLGKMQPKKYGDKLDIGGNVAITIGKSDADL